MDLRKPYIVLGCESKLDSAIPTYSLFPSTYNIFRKDRTVHGGGVFIGVRNDIIAAEQVRLDVHECEIITVSIKFAKSKTLLLSSYYCPPAPDTNALDLLDDILSRIYPCWWLQLWGHRLVNSKPYTSYCSSLRPSSLGSFRQIQFNSVCVFADAPRFRLYIRPCLLLQSWYHSGLSCHLQHLWSWRQAIQDWHFCEVHVETPAKSISFTRATLSA